MADRRPRGSGHYNKKRGRWEGRITIGVDSEGRQIRKKATGRTKAEMEARLRELADAADGGRDTARRDLTVRRFLEDWLDNVLPGTVANATEDQYRQIARLYLIPHLGRKHLRTLQPNDVTAMMRTMDQADLSSNTQRLARAVLRRSLRWAEINGWVARNVAALANPPKVAATAGKALTAEQARSLLAYLADTSNGEKSAPTPSRYEGAITVALSLGLRRGELLGLAWTDVDLVAGKLTVRNALKRRQGKGLAIEPPKTRGSRRTIPLPAPVADSLKRHRKRQAEERLAAGELWDPAPLETDLVFRQEDGSPIDPNNFGAAVRRACRDAKIPGTWSPHTLRHSAASLLLAQRVPLKVISEVLGHSSIRVTADVYSHLLDEAKVEAADAMTEALWGEVQ